MDVDDDATGVLDEDSGKLGLRGVEEGDMMPEEEVGKNQSMEDDQEESYLFAVVIDRDFRRPRTRA